MRNKLFYLTILLTLICMPSIVKAHEGMYIGVLGGVNLLQKQHRQHENITYKTGYAAGAVAGYGLCNNLRVEGEFLYRRNNVKHIHNDKGTFKCGHTRAYSLMANCLYDFDVCYPVTPYVGLGLGADRDTVAMTVEAGRRHQEHRTRFAAQAIAGLSYPVYDHTEMSVDYRYHWAMSHQNNHTFTMGLKYLF